MSISFTHIIDVEEARRAWLDFSPGLTIFDDWDFRACFHKYHQQDIQFLAGHDNGEMIGLLPLQYNRNKCVLEFFGGEYMEDNRVFVKKGYEDATPLFYEHIRSKATLEYICGDDPWTRSLSVRDYKYVLPVHGLTSADDYLEKYFVAHGETRKTIRKRTRQIYSQGVEIIKNHTPDLELLFEYNAKAFGSDSSFIARPFRKEIFRDLLLLPISPQLLTFVVQGVKQAVSLSFLYNKKSYAYATSGANPDGPKGLVTYCNIATIAHAISLGADEVDAFTGDCGWKEHWQFGKQPQYYFHVA